MGMIKELLEMNDIRINNEKETEVASE